MNVNSGTSLCSFKTPNSPNITAIIQARRSSENSTVGLIVSLYLINKGLESENVYLLSPILGGFEPNHLAKIAVSAI
jgi:hypothetical protein